MYLHRHSNALPHFIRGISLRLVRTVPSGSNESSVVGPSARQLDSPEINQDPPASCEELLAATGVVNVCVTTARSDFWFKTTMKRLAQMRRTETYFFTERRAGNDTRGFTPCRKCRSSAIIWSYGFVC